MPTQSEEQLKKAIQTTDSLAAAGSLNPRQADRFIDYVVDLSDLKNRARVVRFRNKQYDIDEATLGRRVAMAKKEASDPQKRRSAGHEKISILPKDIAVPFEISHQYLRQNLEGMTMEDHIIEMMAKQLATDLEELYVLGDTLGPAALAEDLFPGSGAGWIKDEFLGLQDGWSKLAESGHIYDAAGANISPTIFNNAMQTLPEKYQRDMSMMRFLLPTNLNHKYNNRISQREDSAGVATLSGGNAPAFGVPRLNVPIWTTAPKVVEHVVLNAEVPVQLLNAPIQSILAVTTSTLGSQVPETPYVEATDYDVDLALGQINRIALGTIPDGATVKVTYEAYPQMLFCNLMNLIVGLDTEDIRILRGQEIFKDVWQYVMHIRAGVKIQNDDAVVKVKNIGLG